MKISELMPPTREHRQTGNQPPTADFSQWLTNPAQGEGGDDYYLRHQDQWQKSELTFDAQPLTVKRPSATRCDEDFDPAHMHAFSDTRAPQRENTHYEPQLTLSITRMASGKLAHIIDQLHQSLTPTAIAEAPFPQIWNDTASSVVKASSPSAQSNNALNTHHLFIEGEVAELTMNTQELDSQEQKELVKLIKYSLKQKGLALSKLIINGVAQ